jgi:hypothetical protein
VHTRHLLLGKIGGDAVGPLAEDHPEAFITPEVRDARSIQQFDAQVGVAAGDVLMTNRASRMALR